MREALEQGHEVTALARNPSAVAPEDPRLRVLQGNALDASEVEAAVAGQDAVLSALGTRSSRPTTLFSESTHNVISAMNKHGVRRLVCITGIGVGDSKGHVGFLYDRIIRPFVVKTDVTLAVTDSDACYADQAAHPMLVHRADDIV